MRPRSKSVATWLALLGGSVGLHRFYLRGAADWLSWLHLPPTILGAIGLFRARQLGQDDLLAWLLLPLLGLMLTQGALYAIVYGLMPDERWHLRHGGPEAPQVTRWGPVLGAIAALLLGGTVLMSTIAFSVQRFFEWQLGPAAQLQNSSRLIT